MLFITKGDFDVHVLFTSQGWLCLFFCILGKTSKGTRRCQVTTEEANGRKEASWGWSQKKVFLKQYYFDL